MEEVTGKCHLCKELAATVAYCPVCEHWFCGGCRDRWFSRGLEAVKQIVRGKTPGCCGPRG